MGATCCKCLKNGASERSEENGSQADTVARRSPQRIYTDTRVSVEGSEYSFGLPNNGGHGIIIINHRTPPERRNSVNIESERSSRGGIFTCGYTTASFQKYVRRKRNAFPSGNFIDCRTIPLRNYVLELQVLVRWSHSVCQIRFGNGTATGFRVGSRFIMTASHVVGKICETIIPRREHSDDHSQIAALSHRNVFCLFDYFEESQFENVRKYFFKAVVHFYNEETDTAVLELDDNHGTLPMAPPFQHFGFPNFEGNFTFLGHEGSAMEYNKIDLLIDKEHEKTREDIKYVKDYNGRQTKERYDCPPNNTLTNEHRLLFHCKFGKGASGSPGILVQGDGSVVVVTMLLCGFPNWYYAENVDRDLRKQWPKEYCIEQGADMISVENIMRRENPNLHKEIFCRYNLPTPSLN